MDGTASDGVPAASVAGIRRFGKKQNQLTGSGRVDSSGGSASKARSVRASTSGSDVERGPTSDQSAGLVRRTGKVVTAALCAAAVACLGLGALVQTGHLHFQTVLSGSMRPGIQPGDVIATWRVPTSSLRVGDVIVFYPPGKSIPVVHRIVELHHTGRGMEIATKGDANHVRDPWDPVIVRGQWSYQLERVIPKVGWLAYWVRRVPDGRGAVLILAGAILLIVLAREGLAGRGRTAGAGESKSGEPEEGNRRDEECELIAR